MGSDRFDIDNIDDDEQTNRMTIILGDNNARVLYYELQYNTSFQQNDWISVPVEQRRESYTEIKSQDGSIKLEPKTTSKTERSFSFFEIFHHFYFVFSFSIDTFTFESIRFTSYVIMLGELYFSCYRL